MDFDNPKVYGDTSIADGLVYIHYEVYMEKVDSMLCFLVFPHG